MVFKDTMSHKTYEIMKDSEVEADSRYTFFNDK